MDTGIRRYDGGLIFHRAEPMMFRNWIFLLTALVSVVVTSASPYWPSLVVGCGIAVEKAFQGGGDKLRAMGVRVESLARIKAMSDDGKIEFCS